MAVPLTVMVARLSILAGGGASSAAFLTIILWRQKIFQATPTWFEHEIAFVYVFHPIYCVGGTTLEP